MSQPLNYFEYAPKTMSVLLQQEDQIKEFFKTNSEVSYPALELIKLRISQINQCAFCIDMHHKQATKLGESEERLYGLAAWHEMPFYSDSERLALEWAEHLTAGGRISEELYEQVRTHLGEATLVHLTIAINAINSWNRIAKAFKPRLGSFAAD